MLNQPETNSGNCPRKIWRSSINEWHIYTIYTTVHSGDNIVNRHMYQWSNNNWKQCLPMAQAQILHLKSKLMEKAFTWLRDTPASPEDSEHRVKVSSSRQATSLLYLLHSWALQSPPATELYNLQTAAHRCYSLVSEIMQKKTQTVTSGLCLWNELPSDITSAPSLCLQTISRLSCSIVRTSN